MTGPVYATNQATADQICAHLAACNFTPPLGTRVVLTDYAVKLATFAERFEAWVGGHLIGLVAIYCNDPAKAAAHITNVSVDPAHTRHGIARHLLDMALTEAASRGFATVSLQVDPRADAALALYSAMGFATIGTTAGMITLGKDPKGRN